MSSRKMSPSVVKVRPITTFSMMALLRMRKARCLFPCPSRMEMSDDAPTPTSEPKAAMRFISGMAMARPLMAMAPTPCPMKMLSMML